MSQTSRARFGIMTAPSQVEYDDVLRVWREADMIPEIEHAWLFDHLMPIFGDPDGPTHEGWTLLAALAAQTHRLRVGLLVTSNRFRPPAMLAKIATEDLATVEPLLRQAARVEHCCFRPGGRDEDPAPDRRLTPFGFGSLRTHRRSRAP
jgi:hypothetical protein